MQHFRSGLTRLKNLIEEKLPNENDIYGYPGVSRESLLAAINGAHTLSREIKEGAKPRFEIISLKRSGSDLYKNLKDFLESDFENQDKPIGFNDFLNSLIALIEKTKITYFIVAKNGIRTDEELARVRATIADLTLLGDELKEQSEAVNSKIETVSEAIDEINENHVNTCQFASEMREWHDTSNEFYTKIYETHEAIEGWDEEIKKWKIEYQKLNEQFTELATQTIQSRDELGNSAKAGKAKETELFRTAADHNALLEEIKDTLEGANRVGMAASFSTRKDELELQQWIWQGIFVVAIAAMALVGGYLILPTLTEAQSTGDWTKLIAELCIISPLIWLGWFAAKQYSYTSRIREDYAFKAASAMAYEGHKKAAREVDEELERSLLELSLINLSQNPIRLYGKVMHATPFHEAMSQVLDKFPKFRKASAEIPPLGKVEFSGDVEDQEEEEA